jgi:hypothetical protein
MYSYVYFSGLRPAAVDRGCKVFKTFTKSDVFCGEMT